MITVRIVLKLAAVNNWSLFQMDVHNAFLQGDLDEEVYMSIPFETEFVLVLVYVDDLLITGNSEDRIREVKDYLHRQFKIKDLGEIKYFLGIEIARSQKGIILSQRKYVLDLISDAGLSGCRPLSVPMGQNLKLRAFEEGKDAEKDLLREPERYRRLIGRLIYLTITRPDISFSVQVLSQFMQTPTKMHMGAALGVVRYLKQNPGLGILLSSNEDLKVSCFCDSYWGACATTRRSVTGYLLKMGDSLITWKTKKQSTVSRSSVEAEYRALGAAVSEIVWVKGLLEDLRVCHPQPVRVFCDSKAAIHIASNPVFHERTKHIEIDCHFVREKLQSGLISLIHVKSSNQEANILTKAVGYDSQRKMLSKLGTINIYSSKLEGEC
ncbi:uncharacterized protein LOC114712935 [Neltuma alba]|uniref:uncharacterized protein LOC114712935 n=1 Tax=Neltuma alba TaxID=207710 RepID=UPI0010A4EFB3|nr:uncharacterized protein LOC114712935 [Prosopis alba]